jgi:type I restriction enzyme S subunit
MTEMLSLSKLGTLRNGMNYDRQAVVSGCKIIGVADFGNKVFPDYQTLQEIDSSIISDDDLLHNGDILFVRSNGNKNLVGRSMFIKDIQESVCYSGFCIMLRPNCDIVLPQYLFYALRSPFCRKQYSYSQQTNITNLSQSVLNSVIVPIPSYADQKKSAKILYDIDQKIENNNLICAELEAMAKTLYDYWFVQFEFPDENGRPYCTSGGEMIWNEQLKREIPKGWSAGKLADIANITMGQSPTGESYNEMGEGIIFYQGRTDFGLRFPTPRMYTTEPSRFAKKGDILLSVRAPVGDLNLAMEPCCIGRGLAALNSKIGSQMHLFYTLSGFKQIFDIMDGNGTTFGSITKDILFDMSVVIPTNPLLCEFEKHVKPIETKIQVCEQENRELTKLRDWLLPMLMNGQVRVE